MYLYLPGPSKGVPIKIFKGGYPCQTSSCTTESKAVFFFRGSCGIPKQSMGWYMSQHLPRKINHSCRYNISVPWMVWDLKRQVLWKTSTWPIGTSRSAAKARLGSEFRLCETIRCDSEVNPVPTCHQLKAWGGGSRNRRKKWSLKKRNGHYKMGPNTS